MSAGVQITTSTGIVVFRTTDWDKDEERNRIRKPGVYKGLCKIPKNFLSKGMYTVSWIMDDPGVKMIKEYDLFRFEISTSIRMGGKYDRPGVVRVNLPWETERVDSV